MGFSRHLATGLITIKKSTIFANSTFRILIHSVRLIPSMVAPQQSHSPFFLTCKYSKSLTDTVYFTLPKTGNSLKNKAIGLAAYHLYCCD